MVYIDLTKVGRTGLGDAQAGRTVQEIGENGKRNRGIRACLMIGDMPDSEEFFCLTSQIFAGVHIVQ